MRRLLTLALLAQVAATAPSTTRPATGPATQTSTRPSTQPAALSAGQVRAWLAKHAAGARGVIFRSRSGVWHGDESDIELVLLAGGSAKVKMYGFGVNIIPSEYEVDDAGRRVLRRPAAAADVGPRDPARCLRGGVLLDRRRASPRARRHPPRRVAVRRERLSARG